MLKMGQMRVKNKKKKKKKQNKKKTQCIQSNLWVESRCVYVDFQSEYGGYIYSYALQSISRMNKTEGAYLNAVYWVIIDCNRSMSYLRSSKLDRVCVFVRVYAHI